MPASRAASDRGIVAAGAGLSNASGAPPTRNGPRPSGGDAALHGDLDKALQALAEPPYAPWGEDDQTARIRAQLADFLLAIREEREPSVSAASGAEPIKVLDGFHWHGWRHAAAFAAWFRAHGGLAELAPAGPELTVEDAVAAGWTGGRALQEIMQIVRSPAPRLTAPFLGDAA